MSKSNVFSAFFVKMDNREKIHPQVHAQLAIFVMLEPFYQRNALQELSRMRLVEKLAMNVQRGRMCCMNMICQWFVSSTAFVKSSTISFVRLQCSSCRYYCNPNDGSDSNINPAVCPKGHICPRGTGISTSNPCPKGTYNPNEYGSSIRDCQHCEGGHYCDQVGMAKPSGNCSAGI